MMWTAVLVASAACYAAKIAGLSVPPRVLADRRVGHVASVLPIALLATLIATQTFADGRHLAIDARSAGLAAAVVAQILKAPFIVVVVVGCAATALVRLAA
jgi:branched-subunit amino acid transport protein